MGSEGLVVLAGTRRRRTAVRFSAALGRTICRRVASGEALSAACRDEGMPTHATVNAWAKAYPKFGKALRRAREVAGWPCATGPGPRYCDVAAAEIYVRLCEGEALSRICADPAMPGRSSVYRWRLSQDGFDAALKLAREVQAEDLCDRGRDWMEAATPETAYVTRVKLEHLRWMAMALGPKAFGRRRPMAALDADEGDAGGDAAPAKPPQITFYARQFERVIGPDGKATVVEIPPPWLNKGAG